MNYYIQGNKDKADKIKAAFEKLGYKNIHDFKFKNEYHLYFSCNGEVNNCGNNGVIAEIIKTHPDYKELELPKPHYSISNFNPFDKVLVRDEKSEKWVATFYSHYRSGENYHPYNFVTIGTDDVWIQCIPFEGNEHLLGTTDMCDEQYINW